MNDKQVLVILIGIIRAALNNQGITDIDILRGFQTRQQGVPERGVIYIHKISTQRYGHPEEVNAYNSGNDNIDQSSRFWKTPAWQFSIRKQESTDVDAMTAGDLADIVSDIMQLPSTRDALLLSGIGLERVLQIRNMYEVNEKDRNEHIPNFDVTLSYNRVYESTVIAVDDIEHNISRV